MAEFLLALFLFALIYGGLVREHREQEDRRLWRLAREAVTRFKKDGSWNGSWIRYSHAIDRAIEAVRGLGIFTNPDLGIPWEEHDGEG